MTHVPWLLATPRLPAIVGTETFAIEVSSTSMNVPNARASVSRARVPGENAGGAPAEPAGPAAAGGCTGGAGGAPATSEGAAVVDADAAVSARPDAPDAGDDAGAAGAAAPDAGTKSEADTATSDMARPWCFV
ncbi:protein of unknown function [Pararobbsia alpina]